MIRTYRAELTRLVRRRLVVLTAIGVAVIAAAGPAMVMSSAEPAAQVGRANYTPTLESLARAGGGTEIFRYTAAFWGTVAFAVFVGLFALEFSRGTYRTMLLRQPHRVALLAGRLAATLTYAAVTLAGVELVMWVAARLEAPLDDVSTHRWAGLAGLGAALSDYAIVLVWVAGYAVLALAVAMLLRSVPLALAVGIAWAGPVEHLTRNAWPTAQQVFPGLLLEVIGQRGTPSVTMTHAVVTIAAHMAVAAAVGAFVFSRRDIAA